MINKPIFLVFGLVAFLTSCSNQILNHDTELYSKSFPLIFTNGDYPKRIALLSDLTLGLAHFKTEKEKGSFKFINNEDWDFILKTEAPKNEQHSLLALRNVKLPKNKTPLKGTYIAFSQLIYSPNKTRAFATFFINSPMHDGYLFFELKNEKWEVIVQGSSFIY